MKRVQLVVFDITGTVVVDRGEALQLFLEAARQTGITTSSADVHAMMGWSKVDVFRTLWYGKLQEPSEELEDRVVQSYACFTSLLEDYYCTAHLEITNGVFDVFTALVSRGIKLALTTGLNRKVTDIILNRVGLTDSMGRLFDAADACMVHATVSSDEVKRGRPSPDMIFRAMELADIDDVARVVKIGDTPADLEAGISAGCLLSVGYTNGSHTVEQLGVHPHDALVDNMRDFMSLLEMHWEYI